MGIASVTSSAQAVDMYKNMSSDLLSRACSGREATKNCSTCSPSCDWRWHAKARRARQGRF
ncbi:hypothetical protein NWF32_22900 [Pseudomonas qingdaonensis]|nr:hypothetical protein [Pseudomonas qingdaonensis]